MVPPGAPAPARGCQRGLGETTSGGRVGRNGGHVLSRPGPGLGPAEGRAGLRRTPRGAGAEMPSGGRTGVRGAAFPRERCAGPAVSGRAGCPGLRAAAPRRRAGVAAALRCLPGCPVRGPVLAGDRYAASRVVGFHLKLEQSNCSREGEGCFPRRGDKLPPSVYLGH